MKSRLNKKILPHFGDMAVEDVGYTELANFIGILSADGNTSTTLTQYIVAIRKVLNHAQSLNLIQQLPKFPQVKVQNNPRGSFTVGEYKLMLRTAKKFAGKQIAIKTTNKSLRGAGEIDRYLTMPFDMAWVIGFMVNSFIRPSDLKTLQHQHVEIIRGEHIYLRLNLPETKKHDTPIVTLQPAVRIYMHLLARAKQSGLAKANDYLFLAHQRDRTKAMEQMGFAFKQVLTEAKLTNNAANQQKRSLYSLRHTAITFRLLYGKGIDLLTLARNARTSVEMIEKFYASNLSAEMNIGMLQSKRSRDK